MFHKMKDDLFNIGLLEFFVALLRTRSLIKTGKRFGYSQAGSCRALEKLRQGFNDPLFMSSNKGLVPTAYALSILPQVVETIERLRMLSGSQSFKPEECTRTFHFASRGYMTGKALVDIVPKFHQQAPKASIEIHHRSGNYAKELEDRIIDVAWVTEKMVTPNMRYLNLHEIDLCLLCSKNHPLAVESARSGISPNDSEITKYPLLALCVGGTYEAEDYFDAGKLRHYPRVVRTPELSFVLPLVSKSDYLCISPTAAALFAMEYYPLTYIRLDNSSLKSATQMGVLVWNDLTHKDPAMIWFRGLFRQWAEEHKKRLGQN